MKGFHQNVWEIQNMKDQDAYFFYTFFLKLVQNYYTRKIFRTRSKEIVNVGYCITLST